MKLNRTIPLIFFTENENTIIIANNQLLFTLAYLKLHINTQYNLLVCISGVDFIGKIYRFCVSYELLSLTFNTRIRIKTFLNETTSLLSSTEFFINAN